MAQNRGCHFRCIGSQLGATRTGTNNSIHENMSCEASTAAQSEKLALLLDVHDISELLPAVNSVFYFESTTAIREVAPRVAEQRMRGFSAGLGRKRAQRRGWLAAEPGMREEDCASGIPKFLREVASDAGGGVGGQVFAGRDAMRLAELFAGSE